MWNGGVAICNRSALVRPSASTQWRVPWNIVRWVWQTAFGSPVVPELNTMTARSSRSMSSGPAGTSTAGTSSMERSTSDGARAPIGRPSRAEVGRPRPVGDEVGRLGDRERVFDLAFTPRRADHDEGRPEPGRGEHDGDELGAVAGAETDPRPRGDPVGGEERGRPVDQSEQVSVGPSRFVDSQCDVVAAGLDGIDEQLADRTRVGVHAPTRPGSGRTLIVISVVIRELIRRRFRQRGTGRRRCDRARSRARRTPTPRRR